MNFTPGAKMLAIAVDDTTQTIFPAGITRIISHNFFSFFPGHLYSYNPSGYTLELTDYHIRSNDVSDMIRKFLKPAVLSYR